MPRGLTHGCRRSYKVDDKVQVVIVEKKGRRVLCSLKPSFMAINTSPATLAEASKEQVLTGFVRSITDYGIFVGLMHGIVSSAAVAYWPVFILLACACLPSRGSYPDSLVLI